jgi:hypothetical protein
MRSPVPIRRALTGALSAAALALTLGSCGAGDTASGSQTTSAADALQDLAKQFDEDLGEIDEGSIELGPVDCGDLWVGDSCEMLVGYADNFQPVKAAVTVRGLDSHAASKEERQLGCGDNLDLAPIWETKVELENLTDIDVSGLDWKIDVGLAGPEDSGVGFPVDANAAALTFGPVGSNGTQTVVLPIAKCPPSDGYRVVVLFANSGNTGSEEWTLK